MNFSRIFGARFSGMRIFGVYSLLVLFFVVIDGFVAAFLIVAVVIVAAASPRQNIE